MKQYSRVCERVDLDAIFYNFQMMKANIKDGVQMIAVKKTNSCAWMHFPGSVGSND